MIPTNPHIAIVFNSFSFDAKNRKFIETDPIAFDSFTDNAGLFKQVTVQLTTNLASEALVRVFDPSYDFLEQFLSGDGVPLRSMRVWLGFGNDMGESVFKGLLARVERNETDTTLRAYDMGYVMRLQKHTEYHKGLDGIGIIKKLAERNGLKFVGTDKPIHLPKHNSYIHDAKTDWELASEIAEEIGVVLYVRGDTLFAKEPARTDKDNTVLSIVNREDERLLRQFDFSYKLPENTQGRPAVVEFRGRRHRGKRLVGRSEESARGTKDILIKHDLPIHSKGYANRVAHAKKELQREHAFSCTLRRIPDLAEAQTRPDARDTIQLLNFGKLFSGHYICDSVTHDFTPGSFSTEYNLYRDIDVP